MKAKQRERLLGDESWSIPCIIDGKEQFYVLHKWCHAEQPDEYDDEEYNVKVALPNGKTGWFQSIDLQFKED